MSLPLCWLFNASSSTFIALYDPYSIGSPFSLLPAFKTKDPMECGSHTAIKLLEHAMKVIERVFERRIREKVKIDAV